MQNKKLNLVYEKKNMIEYFYNNSGLRSQTAGINIVLVGVHFQNNVLYIYIGLLLVNDST